MGALVEKVVGQMYPSTPIPPLGPSPHRPLGMTVRVLPRRKNFPTHGPWDRVVCKPVTGLTTMKNGCCFWRLVTQPDQILEWLCGLCRPTGKADGPHGGHKGWTWLYRGPEWALCPVALGLGCPWKPEGGPRSEESQIRVTSP